MKRILLALLVSMTLIATANNEKLQNYELVASYSIEDLQAYWKQLGLPEFIVKIENGVDVYELIYNSTWPDGSPVKASGLYYVPKGDKPAPTVIYDHGTQIQKEREVKLRGEQSICILFCASGYAVVRPDYFGLGKGEGRHLYVHAESEAMASIDMLRSVKELNPTIGVKLTDHLFITGYSQGGHAAMATHKYMQEHYTDEFNVTASSPMSGPYDISGVQGEVMFKEYSHPGYLPYMLYGYNEVYNMYPDINVVFQSPYDTLLPPLYDGYHKFGAINDVMPSVPKDIMKPELIEAFMNGEVPQLIDALKDNDVYDWAPKAPTQICYCTADEQVSYKNALVAYKTMKKNGAERVVLRQSGKKFNHGTCALYTSIYTKMWFDSFVKGSKKGKKGPAFKRFLINLSKPKVYKKQKKHEAKKKLSNSGN